MRNFIVVAAAGPARIALQDGNEFFVRTPDSPDEQIPWQGDDPELMIAALVTKWGFTPVKGRPEIRDDQVPLLKGPVKQENGAEEWEVEEIIPYEKVEKKPRFVQAPKKD
jgi:hypothetical protein